MGRKSKEVTYPPLVFNIFKPAGMTSYDVVRHFKRNLPDGYGKIGHFGTLDPFASGTLLIGVAGAARLNDLVHEYCPKTYLAVGKLGVETATGDMTEGITQTDDSEYTKQIASFTKEFIEERIQARFMGEYWQAPHKYSAAKFQGKALHQWAREGVEIKKEKKLRFISRLEVVKFEYPYLSIRTTVSSGTYIRTLFSDIANELGTIGALISLVRESIGGLSIKSAIYKRDWPKNDDWNYEQYGSVVNQVLPFKAIHLEEEQSKKYANGMTLNDRSEKEGYYFVYSELSQILGIGVVKEGILKAQLNFPSRAS
jgi:tRNA pseudouridine55 synthase